MPKLKSRLKTKSRPPSATARQKNAPKALPVLRGNALNRAVEGFQAEPDEKKAQAQWKQIESSVFGVDFED